MAWLSLAVCLSLPALADSPEASGWRSLFNGKDLSGWMGLNGEPVNWEVAEDGTLRNRGGMEGVRVLLTEAEYGDFELSLEFNYDKGCNSGVFFRTPNLEKGRPAFEGNEIQIVDEAEPRYAEKMTEDRRTGAYYSVAPPLAKADKGPGVWQTLILRCEGSHLLVKLNGVTVQDADLSEYPEELKSEHPGLALEKGHLGVQSKDTPVRFRKLKVRPLS